MVINADIVSEQDCAICNPCKPAMAVNISTHGIKTSPLRNVARNVASPLFPMD